MDTSDLRDAHGGPEPYGIVAEFWPYDGPYDEYITTSAATAIERLVRYLNNATQYRAALPYASTANAVLSVLSAAVFGAEQLTRQLRDFAERLADDPMLYDDRSSESMRGGGTDAQMTALDLAAELEEMQPAIAVLAGRLQRAAGIASHLGHRTPEDGAQ